jgi:glycosyltransferase involved in cell wall biosynthesis
MKLLIITSTFPRWKNDTQAPFVYYFAKQLVTEGNEVVVLAPYDRGAEKSEEIEGIKIRRFKYFFPTSYQRLCYGAGMLPNTRNSVLAKIQVPFFIASEALAILKVYYKERPDVLNAHWLVPQGFVVALIKPFIKSTIVVTVHGSDFFSFQKGIKKNIISVVGNMADIVTVNSSATYKLANDKFHIKNSYLVPMGVALNDFEARDSKTPHPKESPTLLIVGRLIDWKGTKYVIEALKLVRESYQKANLIIVGDGPERNNLIKLTKELDLENSIKFVGKIPPSKIPELYSKADVYISASYEVEDGGTEGLGVVILEALASKLPVVASKSGGVVDIIQNEKTGLLIPEKDSEAIALAVLKILKNRELQKSLKINGYNFVKNNFSWELIVKKFLNVPGLTDFRK